MLHDPRYLADFSRSVEEISLGFWTTFDLTSTFSDITVAMDNMLWIADLILWGGIFAVVISTSLLVTLFLRDRKHEIGILLALGERKRTVIIQIIFEVMSVSIIAITLSSFSGNLLSRVISRQMLENQIIQTREETEFSGTSGVFDGFNDVSMPIEDMMSAYEVSLEPHFLIIFFSAGIGVILLSTVIPIIYIMRVNPKEILM